MSTGLPPESTSTQAASSPPGAPPTGTAEFRYGDGPDVPTWARGKSAAEVLGITTQLYGTVEQITRGNAPSAPLAPTPPAQQQGIQQPSDRNYLDPDMPMTYGQVQQWGQQTLDQRIAPQIAQLAEMVASNNLNTVKTATKNAEIFDKYGPEIYGYLGRIGDKRQWTVDNLQEIVNIVRGHHVDDLVNEKASRIAASQVETLRSSGAAGLNPMGTSQPNLTLDSDKLPQEYRERLKRVGLTLDSVREFCYSNNMRVEDWFKQFESQAITETSGVGRRAVEEISFKQRG